MRDTTSIKTIRFQNLLSGLQEERQTRLTIVNSKDIYFNSLPLKVQKKRKFQNKEPKESVSVKQNRRENTSLKVRFPSKDLSKTIFAHPHNKSNVRK